MTSYVLDTSALMALRDNEPGAEQVAKILKDSKANDSEALVSFMTFMEFFYWSWREQGKELAHQALVELKMLPVRRVDLNETLLFLAGEIKALYPMSVADSWIAATAIDNNAILIHKDPEFEKLEGRLEMKPLPYK